MSAPTTPDALTQLLPSIPDGSHTPPHIAPDFPPTTFSCACCERIIGDSSALLFQYLSRTLTFSHLVSVHTPGALHIAVEGAWDEFCNYRKIECARCGTELGRKYFATTAGLTQFQGRLTVGVDRVLVYMHGGEAPAMGVAAQAEVLRLLQPGQDEVAAGLQAVMAMCVSLNEQQDEVARALVTVSAEVGVDVGKRVLELVGEEGGSVVGATGKGIQGRLESLEKKVKKGSETDVPVRELAKGLDEMSEKIEAFEQLGTSRIEVLEGQLGALNDFWKKFENSNAFGFGNKISVVSNMPPEEANATSILVVTPQEDITPPDPARKREGSSKTKRKRLASPPQSQRTVVANSQSTDEEEKAYQPEIFQLGSGDDEYDEEGEVRLRRRSGGKKRGGFDVVVGGRRATRLSSSGKGKR